MYISPGRLPTVTVRAAQQNQTSKNVGSAKDGKQEVFLGVKGNAQLLGMKGGGTELEMDKNKIRIQLMKPVTWIPLIWGVFCGAAASGMCCYFICPIRKKQSRSDLPKFLTEHISMSIFIRMHRSTMLHPISHRSVHLDAHERCPGRAHVPHVGSHADGLHADDQRLL